MRNSGSTCTSVFIYSRKIYCANVGNSKTILIRFDQNEDECTTVALSSAHKPDDVDLENGGRTDCTKDFKHREVPGLYMTHSFGNSTVARVDVTAVPEIKEHEITPVDKALVLASDGVWKYLSNQEVANIIHPYYR